MTARHQALLDAIAEFSSTVPETTVAALASAIEPLEQKDWNALRATAQRVLAIPSYREAVGHLIVIWQNTASDLAPSSVAFALRASAHSVARVRHSQTVEIVWTGPASNQPFRHTAQVLRSVIDNTKQELLVVAFAVYDIAEIVAALARAASRGVRVRLVVESPQESAGRIAYDALHALGPQVAEHAQIYRWPLEQRPLDAQGRHGSLHAKCAVADRSVALISSANLTSYALSLNMELGVLVNGGPIPLQIAMHVDQLISSRKLVLETRPLQ